MKSRNLIKMIIILSVICIVGIILVSGALKFAENATSQIAKNYSPSPDSMELVPDKALAACPYLVLGGSLIIASGGGLVKVAIKLIDEKSSRT